MSSKKNHNDSPIRMLSELQTNKQRASSNLNKCQTEQNAWLLNQKTEGSGVNGQTSQPTWLCLSRGFHTLLGSAIHRLPVIRLLLQLTVARYVLSHSDFPWTSAWSPVKAWKRHFSVILSLLQGQQGNCIGLDHPGQMVAHTAHTHMTCKIMELLLCERRSSWFSRITHPPHIMLMASAD